MKIAIPSNDKVTINKHFGRSKGFLVVEIQDKKVVNTEYKENNFTGHSHGHSHQHGHNHEHGEGGGHSHEGIFNAIGNCEVVISGGMGRRLYNDFAQNKIDVYVTQEQNVEKAIQLFINNSLDHNSDKCCDH